MGNKYKIQLVFPEGGSKLSSSGILPPVGIISLATYLKSRMPDLEVQLFDGEVTSSQDIIGKLAADIVGISTTGANYHNALKIAKEAKNRGARVIVGGSHATVKHRQILENQNCIDAVVRGNGETVLYEFVEANRTGNYERLRGVRNLSYRDGNGSIKVNPTLKICEQANLDELPAPDYSLLGPLLEQYAQNFQNHAYRREGFTRFVSLESQKGCAKTERESKKKGRCAFCARIDQGLRRLSPKEFWERVRLLYDSNGKTMIWDVSDSFSGAISTEDDWLKQVAESKPSDLEGKVNFKIFARADELDEERVKYLKQIGVYEAFIGIESGDQELLDAMNKGSTVGDNLQAVENLKKYGMQTYASLIYALPGEDSESLEKTYQHTKELLKRGKIAGIGARVLYPIAGCQHYRLLLKNYRRKGQGQLADELEKSDYVHPRQLQLRWLESMTGTNLGEITAFHTRLMELAKGYGVKINDPERLLFLEEE